MREQALSDDGVIGLINSSFIPVWVNLQRRAVPDAPAFQELSDWYQKTTSHPLTHWILTSFYLGSVVLSPDGSERLNESKLPWPWTYKEAKEPEYSEMLRGALERAARRLALPPPSENPD